MRRAWAQRTDQVSQQKLEERFKDPISKKKTKQVVSRTCGNNSTSSLSWKDIALKGKEQFLHLKEEEAEKEFATIKQGKVRKEGGEGYKGLRLMNLSRKIQKKRKRVTQGPESLSLAILSQEGI